MAFAENFVDYPGEILINISTEIINMQPETIGLKWAYFHESSDFKQVVFTDGKYQGSYELQIVNPLVAGSEYIIYLSVEALESKILSIQSFEKCVDLIFVLIILSHSCLNRVPPIC